MKAIFQFTKTSAPPLLPFFRSEGQARLLAHLFLHAEVEGIRLTELAAAAGVSPATAHREVARLEEAGLAHSIRRGRERRVRANEDSPYYRELRSLLLKAFGPVTVLRPLLERIDGVESACLFGSWARRYAGEPGPAPRDLDLLVVGWPAPDEVYAACRAAEEELGVEINPTILSSAEWADAGSGFVRAVHAEPLVPVV